MDGLLFFQQENNQSSITNINGSIYALIMLVSFGFAFSVAKVTNFFHIFWFIFHGFFC